MKIHGTGCGIVDCIYTNEDFSGPSYRAALSKKSGDGGLGYGTLVFSDALEAFTGRNYDDALAELTGGKKPSVMNLGGPSLVSLIHAAQSLAALSGAYQVRFFGVRGNDDAGNFFEEKLRLLPLAASLLPKNAPHSRTDALSDPRWENGAGERSFVYRKGASELFTPDDLDGAFFDADVIAFGGTALTPQLHARLTELLKRAKQKAVTIVNLVYDFGGEAAAPGQKWKLGANDDAYPYIDLLLADQEEAVKTSGRKNAGKAAEWFLEQGCGAAAITRGKEPVIFAANEGLFRKTKPARLPVCEAVGRELAEHPERRGDTTGCGDNFTGALIGALSQALAEGGRGGIDLRSLIPCAVAAGGFACFYAGGVYYEQAAGEKRRLLARYLEAYQRQINNPAASG
ncbi:MAG: carbohydrate kinase family protein [Treponema sp.]|jgi:sugar/nucleoside kinase (ribokinase family)|nr:carbohydrate kinase family protein [Treponema sp.]